jgi:hypothetical protein
VLLGHRSGRTDSAVLDIRVKLPAELIPSDGEDEQKMLAEAAEAAEALGATATSPGMPQIQVHGGRPSATRYVGELRRLRRRKIRGPRLCAGRLFGSCARGLAVCENVCEATAW